jgi:hypothetical protein
MFNLICLFICFGKKHLTSHNAPPTFLTVREEFFQEIIAKFIELEMGMLATIVGICVLAYILLNLPQHREKAGLEFEK